MGWRTFPSILNYTDASVGYKIDYLDSLNVTKLHTFITGNKHVWKDLTDILYIFMQTSCFPDIILKIKQNILVCLFQRVGNDRNSNFITLVEINFKSSICIPFRKRILFLQFPERYAMLHIHVK